MTPRVSIIIPCFNQGNYLKDALESLKACNPHSYELIIINDGSTDTETNNYLSSLQKEGYHVVFQENTGLAGARNAGIALARGEFILPLDADNKIRPGYISEGVRIMDENTKVGVVYADAAYFGERSGLWAPGQFNLQKIMLGNYIDACALIRRSAIEQVGGYDTNMQFMGWEDWDLWLRISFSGFQFFYINTVLWDYRVTSNSMSKAVYNAYVKPNTLENYINSKYPDKMGQVHVTNFIVTRFKANPFLFILKLLIRSYFPGYYQELLKKNKIRNGI